jgi:hypothetical protein
MEILNRLFLHTFDSSLLLLQFTLDQERPTIQIGESASSILSILGCPLRAVNNAFQRAHANSWDDVLGLTFCYLSLFLPPPVRLCCHPTRTTLPDCSSKSAFRHTVHQQSRACHQSYSPLRICPRLTHLCLRVREARVRDAPRQFVFVLY